MESANDSQHHHYLKSNGVPIVPNITYRWIRHFMCAQKIVLGCQTGKLLISPSKQEFIAKKVALHLVFLKRGFNDGTLSENTFENADETHVVFNMDN